MVNRRFKEFVRLQECLLANNPGIILPPLPPSIIHWKPDAELIQSRTALLQHYINQVLQNNILSTDPSLWLFVESEEFLGKVNDFNLSLDFAALNAASIPTDGAFVHHPDQIDDRINYLRRITEKLLTFKVMIQSLQESREKMATRVDLVGKAFAGYIDSSTGGEYHANFIQLIGALEEISNLLYDHTITGHRVDALIIELDSLSRSLIEAERTRLEGIKLESIVFHLEYKMVEIQANLINTQNQNATERQFEKNYRLSESYTALRDMLARAKDFHETFKLRMIEELDRLDADRLSCIESGINEILKDLLNTHEKMCSVWDEFIRSCDESVFYTRFTSTSSRVALR